ncbi:anion permease [bacterium]|nr:anion permease [bacterium]
MSRILLVDDEERFRQSLSERLELRGYETVGASNGEDAIKHIRANRDIEVVVLDRKMPGMSGEQTLKEMKEFRPELQVVILTGHGDLESAKEAGKLDAFNYLSKPVDLDQLITIIEAAREEKTYAAVRYEVPVIERGSVWKWFLGSHNSRPLFIIAGLLIFATLALMPLPQRLVTLVSTPKAPAGSDIMVDADIQGYADYRKMKPGATVADFYSEKNDMMREVVAADGSHGKAPMLPEQTARRALIMLALIVLAALFWASGAAPVGVTALLVGVVMYIGDILPPDRIAQAFAKDAVIFIFGVLALSKAITKTGLDRRIGLFLLAPAKNLTLLLLLFLPMLSVTCSFVSEHALVAFTMPLFVMVYGNTMRSLNIKRDRSLMVMFALALCYAANSGGPGSPAAGGRNAIMVGILADYGIAPSFSEWVTYGLPLVPVMSFCVGLYFWLTLRRKTQVKTLNVNSIVRRASEKIGPMTREEYVTLFVLLGVIVLWVTMSSKLGMGGPVILGLVVLNLLRVLSWRDIANIHWEVVFLYASASAIGKGLAVTGAALFMADGFVSILPDMMRSGIGLAVATSIFTGTVTNFMSDGATVAAIGPITVPMATIAGIHPWMVGFATAYASSFAHMLIIGTPSNALAYALAKDPVTGEQLVTLGDFLKHGFMILLISFVVLWAWAFFGYWQWIGFPPVG